MGARHSEAGAFRSELASPPPSGPRMMIGSRFDADCSGVGK